MTTLAALPKGFTTLLLEGVARMLDDNGIARYIPEEDTTSVYLPDDRAVTLKNVLAAPARLITLGTYTPTDDEVLAVGMVQVQFRFRAPGTENDDMADAVFDLFHGARYLPLVAGKPAISSVSRVSSIPLGEDTNGWAERSDNYKMSFSRRTSNHPI
jgi:hypothetical protein